VRYELFIALRYLRSKRRTGFISLITYISAAGVMIGVAALVIVLSAANGFESEVRDRIIGADAHLKLTLFHGAPFENYQATLEKTRALLHVVGASPFISGKGMIRKERSVEGALIKGIDPVTVGEVGDLPSKIVAGSLDLDPPVPEPQSNDDLSPRPRVMLPGIILGRQIAFRLGAAVGDSLILISPSGMTSLFSAPSMMRFRVAGVFETGIFEYDDNYCYISLASAQKLYEMGSTVTGIEFKLDKMNHAEQVKARMSELLGYPYYPESWYDLHATLFRWMKLEKWLFTILLSLIIMVAAFNIVSSQIMIVLEKQREIGILKAMGASRREIVRIFLYEGLIIGIVGTTLGLLAGYAVCWGQLTFKWFSLPGDVYFLNSLPIRMQALDFVVIALVSMGLSILASVYPARRAGALDPVVAIRYE